MAEVIDGKRIAAEIRGEVKQAVDELVSKGVRPGLSVVLVGENRSVWTKCTTSM